MSKKKRKAKKDAGNPFSGRSTDKILDILITERFKDTRNPLIEVLRERKQEATAEILKRIKFEDGSEELSTYSEVLGALCQDEEEYSKLRDEINQVDPQKANLMIAGYWRLPAIKDSGWIKEQIKKSIIPDEKLLYLQLLMDKFLDVEAAKEGLYLVVRRNMFGHIEFFKNSLMKLLAYRGLSFIREEILTMPREETMLLSGAWDEAWNLELEEMKVGNYQLKPLGPDGMLKEEEELLKLGRNGNPEAQFNVLYFIHRFHTGLNEHILPYLDSHSWKVRFEAIYRLIPDNQEKYVNKLWEVFDREETFIEEKYAIISVLSTCRLNFLFDRFNEILNNKEESISVRAAVMNSIPVLDKKIAQEASETSIIGRLINILREFARNNEEHFIIRYSCAKLLEDHLGENLTGEWNSMDKKLYRLGTGEKLPMEDFKEYGLELVEPLVYLHTVLQNDADTSGIEVSVLQHLGREINEKLIDIAQREDMVGRLNSIQLMTILPEERTADVLLEMLPDMIEQQKNVMVQNIAQSLSFHQEHRVKIGDVLLELVKKEEMDDFVVQCLFTVLCALGQPRVLPVLFKMIEEGRVYGMFWGYMVRAVGNLCKERPRAMEIIEEKLEDEEAPLLNFFASNVIQYLMQTQNMPLQELH